MTVHVQGLGDCSDQFAEALHIATSGADEVTEMAGKDGADWGEKDEHYYTPPQTDVHCSTYEETEAFYDSFQPEDIRLL